MKWDFKNTICNVTFNHFSHILEGLWCIMHPIFPFILYSLIFTCHKATLLTIGFSDQYLIKISLCWILDYVHSSFIFWMPLTQQEQFSVAVHGFITVDSSDKLSFLCLIKSQICIQIVFHTPTNWQDWLLLVIVYIFIPQWDFTVCSFDWSSSKGAGKLPRNHWSLITLALATTLV